MKSKFRKKLNFIVYVYIELFSIVFASLMYNFDYMLAGDFLAVLSGVYLFKMIREYPEISMYYKLKKRLYKLALMYQKLLEEFIQYNEIIGIGLIVIFIVLVSFSPLTVLLQWFLVVFFTIFLFIFNEALKTVK